MKNLFVIFGNQLFDPEKLKKHGCSDVFMSEDYGLCTYEKHHKLKIYLFLCAMREYRDELENNGIKVHYFPLDERKKDETYFDFLKSFILEKKLNNINLFEIEDKDLEKQIIDGLIQFKIEYKINSSPMFMFKREEFREVYKNNKVFRLSSFYQYGRKKFKILIDKDNKPIGGKWSFDAENRKKIPSNLFWKF